VNRQHLGVFDMHGLQRVRVQTQQRQDGRSDLGGQDRTRADRSVVDSERCQIGSVRVNAGAIRTGGASAGQSGQSDGANESIAPR
jgi:hypothetical protein